MLIYSLSNSPESAENLAFQMELPGDLRRLRVALAAETPAHNTRSGGKSE
jgi:hypothetical protein